MKTKNVWVRIDVVVLAAYVAIGISNPDLHGVVHDYYTSTLSRRCEVDRNASWDLLECSLSSLSSVSSNALRNLCGLLIIGGAHGHQV